MGNPLRKSALGVILGIGMLSQPNVSEAKFLWWGKEEHRGEVVSESEETKKDYSDIKLDEKKEEPLENANLGIADKSLLPEYGKLNLSTDVKDPLGSYFAHLGNNIGAWQMRYGPLSEFEGKYQQDMMEWRHHSNEYGIDMVEMTKESVEDFFEGIEIIQRAKKEIKRVTSAEFDVRKTTVNIGGGYSSENLLAFQLRVDDFIIDKWVFEYDHGVGTSLEGIVRFKKGSFVGFRFNYSHEPDSLIERRVDEHDSNGQHLGGIVGCDSEIFYKGISNVCEGVYNGVSRVCGGVSNAVRWLNPFKDEKGGVDEKDKLLASN